MLPTLAAAEGRQVEQLDAVVLPTDDPGPERKGGREGGIKWQSGKKELIQER